MAQFFHGKSWPTSEWEYEISFQACMLHFWKGKGTLGHFLIDKGHPMRKMLISTVAFQGHEGKDQRAWRQSYFEWRAVCFIFESARAPRHSLCKKRASYEEIVNFYRIISRAPWQWHGACGGNHLRCLREVSGLGYKQIVHCMTLMQSKRLYPSSLRCATSM